MARTLRVVTDEAATKQSKPRRFGTARQQRSGRWQARFTCPHKSDHPTNPETDKPFPAFHTAPATFETKQKAEKYLAGVLSDIERDRFRCPLPDRLAAQTERREKAAERKAAVPFGRYAREWLDRRENHPTKPLKPRTVMLYRRQLETDVLPTFEDVPLPDITVAMVDEWWERLTDAHPKRATGNSHAYGLLRTIMNAAVRDRKHPRVTANPCQLHPEDIERPAPARAEPATVAQIETIADAMPERLALAVWLGAYSGLRFGELAELRRRDVDLSGDLPVLNVTRGVVHRSGRTIVGAPKSAAGVRSVALPGFLHQPLADHLRDHAQAGAHGLLFTGPNEGSGRCDCGYRGCVGGHLLNSTLHRAYGPAREAAGRPDLKWHGLRHTGATWAAQNGATLAELMHRMGHSTPATAMIYQHGTKERDQELARRMQAQYDAERASSWGQ